MKSLRLAPTRSRVSQRTLAAALLLALSPVANAQAAKSSGAPPPGPSKVDLYAGYGYFDPHGSDINNIKYLTLQPGAVGSITGYFNQYLGVQAEGSFFSNDAKCLYGAQAGPVLRYQWRRLVPFAHAIAGGAKVGGPALQPCTWGLGVTSGIGLDYIVPGFGNHLALRPIQADFVYSNVDYGLLVQPAGLSGGTGEIIGSRYSAGLVARFGDMVPPAPVLLGCTAQPVDAFAGDPVTVTAQAQNLHSKKGGPIYTWTSVGGRVVPTNDTATIATDGLAPGDYAVSGHLAEGKLPSEQASCTTSFRVHAIEPPTVSCTANPSAVAPGDTSAITATAHSPQNRPLTYSFASSAGQVSGNTATGAFSAAGAQPGTVTITCNVVDDLGKQATATTSVAVSAPPPPPRPQVRNLCSLSFERDTKRPMRVDNEAKGCLDDVALTLNRESNARLLIVGEHSASESPESAAERALNARQYLTEEKGIDPARIDIRTGDLPGRRVENTLVPAGASSEASGTRGFDPSSVRRHGQPYGKGRTGSRPGR